MEENYDLLAKVLAELQRHDVLNGLKNFLRACFLF